MIKYEKAQSVINPDDLLVIEQQDSMIKVQEVPPQPTIINEGVDNTPKYPDYMFNDPEFVGFPDYHLQDDIYTLTTFGIDFSQVNSVLDLGCGRGDFGQFLKYKFNNPGHNIKYTGIDKNPIAIDVGNLKWNNLIEFNLINKSIKEHLTDSPHTYDWIFCNSGITNDMSEEYHEPEILNTLLHAYEKCNVGCSFVLLKNNDSLPQGNNIGFYMDEICKFLSFKKIPFAIDNSEYENIFRVLLIKSPFKY